MSVQEYYDKYTALKAAIRALIADVENGNFDQDWEDNCEADADMGEAVAQSILTGKLGKIIEKI